MAIAITTILDIARVSQYLSANDIAKGSLFGERKVPITPKVLYMERKAVEWMYNLDPTNETLRLTANYLYSLCRGYNLEASNIVNSGGGGSITPANPSAIVIPSPIAVRGDDFTSQYSWTGANGANVNVLPSYTLQVLYNPASTMLTESTDWTRTATGFDIVLGGVFSSFDATGANASDLFYIFISP